MTLDVTAPSALQSRQKCAHWEKKLIAVSYKVIKVQVAE